jgi:RNA polymerase sigma-70 factor (ECF subfamily)
MEIAGTVEGEDAVRVRDFDAIIEAYRPRIFRFALASLRDRDAAETVTQDCFVKAHRSWHQFRGDSSVQTWLMQITVNLLRDLSRSRRFQFWKRAARTAVDLDAASAWLPDRGASPEERASARQQVDAIWSVVGNLSERQRTVFLLHFMEGMEPAEIEAITGITRAAVKVHLFRAVHTVRGKLGSSK